MVCSRALALASTAALAARAPARPLEQGKGGRARAYLAAAWKRTAR